jgi:hypothetical protein
LTCRIGWEITPEVAGIIVEAFVGSKRQEAGSRKQEQEKQEQAYWSFSIWHFPFFIFRTVAWFCGRVGRSAGAKWKMENGRWKMTNGKGERRTQHISI